MLASFLMLFIELALIRWTAANNLYLTHLTNFVLLASFLGIGLGFLLAASRRDLFALAPAGLALLVAFVLAFPVQTVDDGGWRLGGALGMAPLPRWVNLPVIFLLTVAVLAGLGQEVARTFARFEPLEAGSGFVFESAVVGGSVPREFIPGVQKGLDSARGTGVIAGFPVIDFKASLIDGAYHDVDSSVLAFEIASRAAFREGLPKAGPKLLEPMMKVEVVTPDDYMGDIIGDLNSRRGQVLGMDQRGNARVISALVPLATMFGYVNTLRSMSQGRAQYTMQFERYADVPQAISEEVRQRLAS